MAKEFSPEVFLEACSAGNTKIVELLLQHDKIDAYDLGEGFKFACWEGKTEIVELLLQHDNIDDISLEEGFEDACMRGKTEIVELLLQHDKIDAFHLERGFEAVCRKGKTEIVEWLLQHDKINANVIAGGFSSAYSAGYTEIAERLLKHDKIDANAIAGGFKYACQEGNTKIVERLLKHDKINADAIGEGFRHACWKGKTEIVELLLQENKIDADAIAKGFKFACMCGNTKIVERLLKHDQINADALAVGFTDAWMRGKTEIVKLLLKHDKGNLAYQSPKLCETIQETLKIDNKTVEDMTADYLSANDTRNSMFTQFPILHETLKGHIFIALATDQKAGNVSLAEDLQKAVDKGDTKTIAGYYGLTASQLTHIPNSNTPKLASGTIIALVKAGLIKAEQLPTEPEQHQAVCNSLESCFKLAEELGFKQFNKNDPHTYPEFLTNLIQTTAQKGPKDWGDMEQTLPEQLYNGKDNPGGIKDMVDDYTKTVFLPYALQNKQEYDVYEELDDLRPHAITSFFKDVPIDTICKLSDKWHKPGRTAQLNKAKTFSGADWEPLFEEPRSYGGITATPLTDSEALKKEGKDLSHCVGGYSNNCLREHSHIVSMRDDNGKPVSTVEFKVVPGKANSNDGKVIAVSRQKNYHLVVQQHYGKGNGRPPDVAERAAKALYDDIRNGKANIDLDGLEAKRAEREVILKDKKELALIGYEVKDTESMEKAREIYRGQHGLKGISKVLTHNFDVLTGKAKAKAQSFIEKAGKKAPVQSPEASIQASMDTLLGEGAVNVAIEGAEGRKPSIVTMTLAEGNKLTLEEIQQTLAKANDKLQTTMDNGKLSITKPTPLPVSRMLEGAIKAKGQASRGG